MSRILSFLICEPISWFFVIQEGGVQQVRSAEYYLQVQAYEYEKGASQSFFSDSAEETLVPSEKAI